MRTIISATIVIVLCLHPLFSSADFYSASWMQPGAYVMYKFNSTGLQFNNGTTILFNKDVPAFFTWKCIGFKEDLNKLNVSLSLNNGSTTYFYSIILLAKYDNRTLYFENGTILGITCLWGPINPKQDDLYLLSLSDVNNNSSEIFGKVRPAGYQSTIQGMQEIYQLNGTGYIHGIRWVVDSFFDTDTGVMIDGYLRPEPALLALGINNQLRNGFQNIVDTNIDLGPSLTSDDTSNPLPLIVTMAVGVIVFLLVSYYIYQVGYRNRFS